MALLLPSTQIFFRADMTSCCPKTRRSKSASGTLIPRRHRRRSLNSEDLEASSFFYKHYLTSRLPGHRLALDAGGSLPLVACARAHAWPGFAFVRAGAAAVLLTGPRPPRPALRPGVLPRPGSRPATPREEGSHP